MKTKVILPWARLLLAIAALALAACSGPGYHPSRAVAVDPFRNDYLLHHRCDHNHHCKQ